MYAVVFGNRRSRVVFNGYGGDDGCSNPTGSFGCGSGGCSLGCGRGGYSSCCGLGPGSGGYKYHHENNHGWFMSIYGS